MLPRNVACGLSIAWLLAAPALGGDVDVRRQARSILSDKCFTCHGPDEETREADLRLDQADGVRTVFADGDLESSEAWRRISSDDADERMPPADSGKPLTEAEIATLRQWMGDGAKWTEHWAFEPIVRPEPPDAGNSDWPRNGIDRFLLARLKKEGLEPSPEAKRETLLRRLSFDLTGLPPTLAELDAFLADDAPGAYERQVERLLRSPHYGERMAMSWLDGARYADTNGYQNDFNRTMWPWRDWVIAAFNAHRPFDEMAIEQLAGDMLPGATREQKLATGFHRNHRTVTEAGSIEEEWLVENVIDRVETTGQVFLGLTIGCARCHDHKYDPVTQREFYQLFAFFHSTADQGVYRETKGNVGPLLRLPSAEQAEQLAAVEAKLSDAERDFAARRGAATELADEIRRYAADNGATTSASPGQPVVWAPLAADTDAADAPPTAAPMKIVGDEALPRESSMFGAAASFQGKQAVEIDAPFLTERDRPISCAVWVRPNGRGAIVSKMDDQAQFRGFDVLLSEAGAVQVHLIHDWPENAVKVESKPTLPRSAWSHVVMTYDGSSCAAGVAIYINGQRAEQTTEVDRLTDSIANDQPLRIGVRSTTAHLNALVHDVRLYDSAFSDEQAHALFRDGLAAIDAVDATDEIVRDDLARLCASLPGTALHNAQKSIDAAKAEKDALDQAIPTAMVLEELPEPRPTYILKRGQYNHADKEQQVEPDVPAFLPPLPSDAPRNRLTLAQWIVSSENPLTARVIVSGLWQHCFGEGLVPTSENFGVQGEPPTHAELLDWLAAELIASGWDLQHVQRLILTSAAYRQSSAASAELVARDPANRLHARGPRFRLPAEMIRDNALAVSGLLSRKIGGPSVKPYQPEGLWDELAGAQRDVYVQDHGDDLHRRSLYTFRKRTVPHPGMTTFDAPSWEVCQVKRARTNTPLQALALLNDVTYVEAARKLAERMIAEGGDAPESRLTHGFRLATARRPNAEELRTLADSVTAYRAALAADADAAQALSSAGESPVEVDAARDELAAYTLAAGVLLNLDETITKE